MDRRRKNNVPINLDTEANNEKGEEGWQEAKSPVPRDTLGI